MRNKKRELRKTEERRKKKFAVKKLKVKKGRHFGFVEQRAARVQTKTKATGRFVNSATNGKRLCVKVTRHK